MISEPIHWQSRLQGSLVNGYKTADGRLTNAQRISSVSALANGVIAGPMEGFGVWPEVEKTAARALIP